MSSDWQFAQTGVERVARVVRAALAAARRLAIWTGSWCELNGLRSEACVMLLPIYSPSTAHAIQQVMCSTVYVIRGPCYGRGMASFAVVKLDPAFVSART